MCQSNSFCFRVASWHLLVTAVSPGPSSSATQNPKLPGEQIEDIAPDISVSPRRSSRMSTNTRKMPTEDQNEIPPTIATDESSSTGSASPLSGLDPSHEHDSNSNEQQTTSSESLDTPVPGNNQGNAVKVKTEADLHKTIAKKYRQYGDRCLLARQAKNANNTNAGMMKLGGGNQAMDLMPGPNNLSAQQKRKDEIGLVKAMAYCCQWNFNGPKYAGQRTAAVTCFPEDLKEGEAFSVFMKRSIGSKLFGWEYCGQYRPLIDDDILSHGTNARLLDQSIKDKMAQDIVKSLRQSNHGFFYERMLTWRRFITEEIEKYEGPKAPAWWVEKREPTDEEKKKYPYPKEIAARALALGFYNTISLEEFAKKIYVELDERYEEDIVEFVEYSEDMYNYVKDGESNRDAMGKSRTKKYSRKKIWNDSFDGECAKASDWYNKYDQHCFKSNQRLN